MIELESSDQIAKLFFPQTDSPLVSFEPDAKEIDEYQDTLTSDFSNARSSINSILKTSEVALDRLMDVVKDTDSPRAFEVAATLIATISNSSKDLLELHEKLHRLKEKTNQANSPVNQTNIQNNIAFKGTSKDLLELIKESSNP